MPVRSAAIKRLTAIPRLSVFVDVPLAAYTRFQMGGQAAVLCETSDSETFAEALRAVPEITLRHTVIGAGTNLVVSDAGFDGIVLRYTGSSITRHGTIIRIESGAILQNVVDYSIKHGRKGLENMTGIPGYLGGAVYGNAGAYGRSIQELIKEVRVTDGESQNTLC